MNGWWRRSVFAGSELAELWAMGPAASLWVEAASQIVSYRSGERLDVTDRGRYAGASRPRLYIGRPAPGALPNNSALPSLSILALMKDWEILECYKYL